jgi:hypothetical protein
MRRRVGGSSLLLGFTTSASVRRTGRFLVSSIGKTERGATRRIRTIDTDLQPRDRPRRSLRHQNPQQRRLDRRHGLLRLQHHDRPSHADRHGKHRVALLPALRRVQFHQRAVLLGIPTRDEEAAT